MTDDLLNARGDAVIGGETEDDGQTPVDTSRDDVADPDKQEVAVGDTVVDDEPEELDEEVANDQEYEPLEPDEPE